MSILKRKGLWGLTLALGTIALITACGGGGSGSTAIDDTTAPVVTASVSGGLYREAQTVALVCDDGSGVGCDAIYYTLDGSAPTSGSTKYNNALTIDRKTTLKFIALDKAGNKSTTVTESYLMLIADTVSDDSRAYVFPVDMASDASGNVMAVWAVRRDKYTVDILYSLFDAASGLWSTEALAAGGLKSYYTQHNLTPQVASDGTGFMLAYMNHVGGSDDVYASEYDGSGWSEAIKIGQGGYYGYDIASNGTGYALVWSYVPNVLISLHDGSSWSAGEKIDAYPGSGINYPTFPRIASDGNGYGVTWTQYNGTQYDVYANVFNGSSWGTAVALELLDGSADGAVIASNGSGYGVSWAQHDGVAQTIYGNIFDTALGGWLGAAPVDSTNVYAYQPAIASNGNGYAVCWTQGAHTYANFAVKSGVVWSLGAAVQIDGNVASTSSCTIAAEGTGYTATWMEYDSTNLIFDIYANRYQGSVWGSATLLESGTKTAEFPQIVDAAGTPLVAWTVTGSTTMALGATRYSGSWLAEVKITNKVYQANAIQPKLASNSEGHTIAVWSQPDMDTWYLMAAIDEGNGWSTPISLTEGSGSLSDGGWHVASDGSGFMVITNWNQKLRALNYVSGVGWQTEAIIENAYVYGLSIASSGNGYMVSWNQSNGTTDTIYYSAFDGSSWSTKSPLSDGINYANSSRVASNGSYYAVTWTQIIGGENEIYVRVFDGSDWSTPRLLSTDMYDAYMPTLVSNGYGYAVSWYQSDGVAWGVYASVYSNSTWADRVVVDSLDSQVDWWYPALASNGSGYMVAWKQDGAVYANRYDGNSWVGAAQVALGSSSDSTDYSLKGMTLQSLGGNYALAWSQADGTSESAYLAEFKQGAWAEPLLLETSDAPVSYVSLIATPAGYRSAWLQADPVHAVDPRAKRIWVTRPYEN